MYNFNFNYARVVFFVCFKCELISLLLLYSSASVIRIQVESFVGRFSLKVDATRKMRRWKLMPDKNAERNGTN